MSTWTLAYDEWDPDRQPLRETMCTLGNGYFATRGAFEEVRAGGVHYPGVYVSGAYNRLRTEVAGRIIENEDLVNWPNWLRVTFRHDGGPWFLLDDAEILQFGQELDLRRGILERHVKFRDREGRTSSLHIRRLVHMRYPHLAAIKWTLLPEDWTGPIRIRSEIDGNVTNAGVARYRQLNSKHIQVVETSFDNEEALLVSQASPSMLRVAQAMRNRVSVDDHPAPVERRDVAEANCIAHEFDVTCEKGCPLTLEKITALYTQRDWAICEPSLEARKAVSRAGSFQQLVHDQELAWARLWEFGDIEIDGHDRVLQILRVHIFHLLQTVSLATTDLDVGVPARGWHGEAYRGHVFWDELFIFPYVTLRIPELTRTLLMYRYRRLGEARQAAADAGHAGAMFPWQSGSNGREESQRLHLNPRSGRWIPDDTFLQRHINAAIAYNVWEYYVATNDDEFLSFFGAELILEIARFFSSIATFNEKRGRYEIKGVVGPDEYHTGYPDSESPGLNNNAYTNVMAAWVLRCAKWVFDGLPRDRCARLRRDLGLTEDETERWDDVSRRLFVPFHDDGIISQFEGYERLAEFDWEACRAEHGDIKRLDRILEAANDSPNRYKASKQADVLMLMYLFSSEQLVDLFRHLGYRFDPAQIPRNVAYYHARTSHGSSLSRVVHAWVLSRSDREGSWACFREALGSDIEDAKGGTTSEGIHLGAMAGTVDIVQRCYTGLEMRDEVLWLNPCLPDELDEIRLKVRFRGHTLSMRVSHRDLEVESCRGGPLPIRIGLMGEAFSLRTGERRRVELPQALAVGGGTES